MKRYRRQGFSKASYIWAIVATITLGCSHLAIAEFPCDTYLKSSDGLFKQAMTDPNHTQTVKKLVVYSTLYEAGQGLCAGKPLLGTLDNPSGELMTLLTLASEKQQNCMAAAEGLKESQAMIAGAFQKNDPAYVLELTKGLKSTNSDLKLHCGNTISKATQEADVFIKKTTQTAEAYPVCLEAAQKSMFHISAANMLIDQKHDKQGAQDMLNKAAFNDARTTLRDKCHLFPDMGSRINKALLDTQNKLK